MRVTALMLALMLLPAPALADAKAGEKKAQICLLCHRVGNTTAPLSAMPLLAGQPARYLYLQTKAFKDKRRTEPSMQTNVANLSDRDMRDIADYLAAQKPVRGTFQLDPAKVATGKTRVEELQCATCHRPGFAGIGEVPRLAGQTPAYLGAQLEAFGAGKRPHGSAPPITMSPQEIEGVAQFLASLE